MNKANLREEDLVFQQIRSGTDQWSVRKHTEDGEEIAIVTERIVATPPYVIRWPEGPDDVCEDRDQVVEKLLAKVNT